MIIFLNEEVEKEEEEKGEEEGNCNRKKWGKVTKFLPSQKKGTVSVQL